MSGGKAHKPDEIALASNTQNRISERTMKSSTTEMRDLRLRLAALVQPWFVVTKDGEWSAILKNKPLFQSRTGNKRPQDFKPAGKPHHRRVENTDLGVAMLAFCGFVEEAKPSRIYKNRYFSNLFGSHPEDQAWSEISKRPVDWGSDRFNKLFVSGQAPAETWALAYFVWQFWKQNTFPESKQLVMAYEETGKEHPEFRRRWYKSGGWEVSDEARETVLENPESCYWVEQVAKSAYLPLVYQSMRILCRAFGALNQQTATAVLQRPQFVDIYSGSTISSLADFRKGSLSDGPLTAIGRILRYACKLLWTERESQIRQMASRQQTLLQPEWVHRLSDKVDYVCDRLPQQHFRANPDLDGPNDVDLKISDVIDLLQ